MKTLKIFSIFIFFSLYLQAQNKEVGIFEQLDKKIPDSVFFTDLNHKKVNVKQLIDKTTIFSFVYYKCPGLCSPLLNGISDVIDKCDAGLGADYQVITISFNPEDTPEMGRAKKNNLIKMMKKQPTDENWIWLVGDSANINKLTNFVGFQYRREGKEFAHGAALVVVSPKGKITKYIYGTSFSPVELKLAIIEAKAELANQGIVKMQNYCYSYEPKGKKYITSINQITGALVLFAALIFLSILIFKNRHKTQDTKK
jgi:protein SCO1/2